MVTVWLTLDCWVCRKFDSATTETVSDAERPAELRLALAALSPDRRTVPKFFQVLLTTTVENYVPGKVSLVSARIIPE